MNSSDLIPIVLLALLTLSLTVGGTIVLVGVRLVRKGSAAASPSVDEIALNPEVTFAHSPPATWMVVRNRSMREVQEALRLHNPKPCPCSEGLCGGQGIFIAPPSGRWTLVTGRGLPDPSDDIDLCFRFMQRLSRKLGTVQYFNSNRLQNHHAWIWFERGKVIRAYAWVGETAWNQGAETTGEQELGLRCLAYSEPMQSSFEGDIAAVNTEKVPLLAARWGVDPGSILDALHEPANGIAGDSERLD